MITRLLVALFALYIVAGSPNPRDLPLASAILAPNSSTATQAEMAKQALDFCLNNRETCASIASGLIHTPVQTGAVSAAPKASETQALPQPAPGLPLPPRRRMTAHRGA